MKKKLPIIILVIGFLLILLGVSLVVYDNLSNEKHKKIETEKRIVNNYETFKKKVELFDTKRTSYYDDVVVDLYIESVKDNYDEWISFLNEYTTTVDDVEKESSYLKEHCVNNYYSNKDIANKCDAFVIAYETVMNYYTKDIVSFNELIDSYRNEYDISNEEVLDYNMKYNYIDINDDGKYIGKD